MSYTLQTFENEKTVLKAEHLQHIENGILTVETNLSNTVYDSDYNRTIRAVNHRGWGDAPENTLPAYVESKKQGFFYVECDVGFTSDGVAVLLHDDTINRTSTGSGNISSLTYAQASKYDFGSWKNTKYAGTKLPTFEEFIALCQALQLHPYIELKNNSKYTKAMITGLVNIVCKYRMKNKVTWISANSTLLEYVISGDACARVGYVTSACNDVTISTMKSLRTGVNEVFLDIDYRQVTSSIADKCRKENIAVEVWTIDDASAVFTLDPYISGITSNYLHADKIKENYAMALYSPIDEESLTSSTFPITLYASDLENMSLSSEPPYKSVVAASPRVSYTKFDILTGISGGTYKIDWTTTGDGQIDMGIQAFDTVFYNASLFGVSSTADNKFDPGWQSGGTATIDLTENKSKAGLDLCGFRLTFGKLSSGTEHNGSISKEEITSVTITKIS